jgi:hypothetical protein
MPQIINFTKTKKYHEHGDKRFSFPTEEITANLPNLETRISQEFKRGQKVRLDNPYIHSVYVIDRVINDKETGENKFQIRDLYNGGDYYKPVAASELLSFESDVKPAFKADQRVRIRKGPTSAEIKVTKISLTDEGWRYGVKEYYNGRWQLDYSFSEEELVEDDRKWVHSNGQRGFEDSDGKFRWI